MQQVARLCNDRAHCLRQCRKCGVSCNSWTRWLTCLLLWTTGAWCCQCRNCGAVAVLVEWGFCRPCTQGQGRGTVIGCTRWRLSTETSSLVSCHRQNHHHHLHHHTHTPLPPSQPPSLLLPSSPPRDPLPPHHRDGTAGKPPPQSPKGGGRQARRPTGTDDCQCSWGAAGSPTGSRAAAGCGLPCSSGAHYLSPPALGGDSSLDSATVSFLVRAWTRGRGERRRRR